MRQALPFPAGASRVLVAAAVISCALSVAGNTGGGQAAPHAPPGHTDADRHTAPPRQWIDIRDTDLHLSDQVVLRVRTLHGEVLRTTATRMPALDDATSFRIRITGATVALTGDDLAAILNTVVFAYPGAPLRDLRVRTDGDEIIQTGIMHKGVDLRFRLRGRLSLMPDGRVRIHPTAVHVLGLNGETMLHLVGLHLDNLLDLRGAHGASVKGDDFFLDPTAILPPPAIDGRLAAVRIEGDAVVQDFERQPDDSVFGTYVRADKADSAFIYFRGGELRFGKLIMVDTDLRIVSTEPRGPLDMSLPHYAEQLVAGRSQVRPDLGLVVTMPNFATLQRADSAKGKAAPGP
jgi:hypothetical protein